MAEETKPDLCAPRHVQVGACLGNVATAIEQVAALVLQIEELGLDAVAKAGGGAQTDRKIIQNLDIALQSLCDISAYARSIGLACDSAWSVDILPALAVLKLECVAAVMNGSETRPENGDRAEDAEIELFT